MNEEIIKLRAKNSDLASHIGVLEATLRRCIVIIDEILTSPSVGGNA